MNLNNPDLLASLLGQQNHPEPETVRTYFHGIFQRQYYTESGPLVRRLEREIGQLLNVAHIVCVSNPTIAWLMLLEATDFGSGYLLVPTTVPGSLQEALYWIDRPCQLYDVSSATGYRSQRAYVEAYMNNVAALITVNPWGGACDLHGLKKLAEEYNVPLFCDSSEAFACCLEKQLIGAWGNAEVFSFEAVNLINGAGGACICTQDEALADRLRCMRGSGGVIRQVAVSKTVNGRMSEAQAAYALMGLERLDYWIKRNKIQHNLYQEILSTVPRLRFLSAQGVNKSNYQQAIIELTMSLEEKSHLTAYLQQYRHEAAAFGGALITNIKHHPVGFCELNSIILSLPLGSRVDLDCIQVISEAVIEIFMTPATGPCPTSRPLLQLTL